MLPRPIVWKSRLISGQIWLGWHQPHVLIFTINGCPLRMHMQKSGIYISIQTHVHRLWSTSNLDSWNLKRGWEEYFIIGHTWLRDQEWSVPSMPQPLETLLPPSNLPQSLSPELLEYVQSNYDLAIRIHGLKRHDCHLGPWYIILHVLYFYLTQLTYIFHFLQVLIYNYNTRTATAATRRSTGAPPTTAASNC